MFGFLVNVCLLFSVIYNILYSMKNTEKRNAKYFRHYFIVLSLLISLDNVFAFILYRLPYYQLFKLVLTVWLSIPNGTAVHFVYNVYIKNGYILFEGRLDDFIANVSAQFKEYYNKYIELAKSKSDSLKCSNKSVSEVNTKKKSDLESSPSLSKKNSLLELSASSEEEISQMANIEDSKTQPEEIQNSVE